MTPLRPSTESTKQKRSQSLDWLLFNRPIRPAQQIASLARARQL